MRSARLRQTVGSHRPSSSSDHREFFRGVASWGLTAALTLLGAAVSVGCVVEVEDDDLAFEDDAAEIEVELVHATEGAQGDDEGADAEHDDIPKAVGQPLEFGIEMEPVPEPWQGKRKR